MGIARDYDSSRRYRVGNDIFQELVYNVTSAADGSVSATQIGNICGYLLNFEVLPDETDTPTTGFDHFLYTDNTTKKLDLLGGEGVGLTVTGDHKKKILVGSAYSEDPYKGNPYFVAADMGNAKKTVFKLTVKVG